MTDEEILKLAKTCGFDSFTGEKETIGWECWEEQLLKFAQAMHKAGWFEGYNDGQSND